ncbi:MAG: hypothetical protein RJA61_11 [Candidatus Parcubacteria bacterium]|jgi:hypothetical protein
MIHFFKKKLFIFLFITLYIVPFQTQAAFNLIANTGAGSSGGNNVTTGAIDTTGANLIVVVVSWYSGAANTLSDSKGNTWTALTAYAAGNTQQRIYYAYNPTVGSGHTFTATNSSYPSIAVSAWSGAATSPYDVENGSSGSGITSKQPGSVTPSENNELIITGLGFDTSNTLSINSGFTISNQLNYTVGNYMGGAMAYLVQTTSAAVNPTWSWSSSMGVSTGIATFKAASATRSFTLKRPPNNFLGLVARYTFDGGDMTSNVADSSGTGNHGYLVGQRSTSTAIGKLGQALSFDGVNDSVSVSSFNLSGTQQATYAFWYNTSTWSLGTDILFTHAAFPTVGYTYMAPNDSGGSCGAGKIEVGHDGGTGFNFACYTQPSTGWHHFVVVHDITQSANEVDLYIDGIYQNPTSRPGVSNNTANLANATLILMAHPSGLNTMGTLDDFRVYSRVLTSVEALALYNSGQNKISKTPTGISNGLIGHWTFDGGDMTSNVADSSGTGNHGYLVGQTSTTTVIGKVAQGLTFDGINDFVKILDNANLRPGTGAFSASIWIKAPNSNQAVTFYGKRLNSNPFTQWNLLIGTVDGSCNVSASKRISVVQFDGTNGECILSNSDYADGNWHHVVLVRNSSQVITTYIDGAVMPVTTPYTLGTGKANINNTEDVQIGTGNAGVFFNGEVDEARYYDRSLSASEVGLLYRLGQTKVRP